MYPDEEFTLDDLIKLSHRDLELPQNLREGVIKDMDHL